MTSTHSLYRTFWDGCNHYKLTFGQVFTSALSMKCIKRQPLGAITIIHQWRINVRSSKLSARRNFSTASTSKTITKEKGEHIKRVLNGEVTSADASFKHWVIKKGFKFIDYPLLGLRQVLCLPTKKKVCVFYYALLLEYMHIHYDNCVLLCKLFRM